MRQTGLLLSLAVSCLPMFATAQEAGTPTRGITTETLLKTSQAWDNSPLADYPATPPEVTLLKITLPAHSSLPWHSHPIPNVAYVLSGTLTVQKMNSTESITITKGQALPELTGAAHRGTTGAEPVELIVFYAGSKGIPLSLPAP